MDVIDVLTCIYESYQTYRGCAYNEELEEQTVSITSILSRARDSISEYVKNKRCCHLYHSYKKASYEIYSSMLKSLSESLSYVYIMIPILLLTHMLIRRIGYRLLKNKERIGTVYRRLSFKPTEGGILEELKKQGYQYYSECNGSKGKGNDWIQYHILKNSEEKEMQKVDMDWKGERY